MVRSASWLIVGASLAESLAVFVSPPPETEAVLVTLAGSALLLAMLGVYGMVAYTVTQRRFEIGIRAAIGATPARILRDLIAAGLSMAGVGAAAGLALAVAINRVITTLLYRVSVFDVRRVLLRAGYALCQAA